MALLQLHLNPARRIPIADRPSFLESLARSHQYICGAQRGRVCCFAMNGVLQGHWRFYVGVLDWGDAVFIPGLVRLLTLLHYELCSNWARIDGFCGVSHILACVWPFTERLVSCLGGPIIVIIFISLLCVISLCGAWPLLDGHSARIYKFLTHSKDLVCWTIYDTLS